MRLRGLGVKVNYHFLRDAAVALVGDLTVPYARTEIEAEKDRSMLDVLSMRWVHDFCTRFNIRVRVRTGKKSLSLQKTLSNNKKLAYHLGFIKREFDEVLDEATVENFDETRLVIDIDNGRV